MSKQSIDVPVWHRLAWTVPQAAAMCGIPEPVIRAAAAHGELTVFYAGSGTVRIRRRDLEAWLLTLPDRPPR